jgi:hypothetical protein
VRSIVVIVIDTRQREVTVIDLRGDSVLEGEQLVADTRPRSSRS